MFYNLIGKATVRILLYWLRRRFVLRTALLTGAGVAAGITVVGVAGYLMTRDVPEA